MSFLSSVEHARGPLWLDKGQKGLSCKGAASHRDYQEPNSQVNQDRGCLLRFSLLFLSSAVRPPRS